MLTLAPLSVDIISTIKLRTQAIDQNPGLALQHLGQGVGLAGRDLGGGDHRDILGHLAQGPGGAGGNLHHLLPVDHQLEEALLLLQNGDHLAAGGSLRPQKQNR